MFSDRQIIQLKDFTTYKTKILGFLGITATPAFSALTSSTNTTAAMVVGTGSSIAASGSGAITATAVAVGGVSGLGTGVGTFLATSSSANLAAAVTDETGSGALVFATSPALVTPALGVATATTINKVTLTAPATGSTLTVNDGVTLTAPTTTNVLVISGTAKLSVGTSTPGSPATGDLWVDTN